MPTCDIDDCASDAVFVLRGRAVPGVEDPSELDDHWTVSETDLEHELQNRSRCQKIRVHACREHQELVTDTRERWTDEPAIRVEATLSRSSIDTP